MRRGLVVAGGAVGLQVALVGGYLVVERGRATEVPFLAETLDLQAPQVVFEGRDGAVELGEGRTIVHFWATWCGPCITELPSLLAAAEAEDVPLVAATDEPWPVVQRFFDGEVPDAIVRDPGAAAGAAYEVSGLPDTFVVKDGRVVARVGGPRDWTDAAARRWLSGAGR